jgi:hypothetical protein
VFLSKKKNHVFLGTLVARFWDVRQHVVNPIKQKKKSRMSPHARPDLLCPVTPNFIAVFFSIFLFFILMDFLYVFFKIIF